MNLDESKKLQQIKMLLVGLSEYYRSPLSENQIVMYAEDLMGLTADELKISIQKYRTNPNNKFFPLPSQLVGEVKPHIEARDEAQDIANVIIACVSKFGYTNPDRARSTIGELGWATISRMGGWAQLCQTLNSNNEGMLRAQIRDYTETVSKKAQRGELNEMPALPMSDEIKKLTSGIKFLEADENV